MEAPDDVTCIGRVKWRRKPGVAGYRFINSACLPPALASLNPLKTLQMPLYAVGVVPARRQPQSGRISALAGRRAAYERVPDN
ncbi:hypothetical protein DMR30_25855 [Klebsiella variicola]|nr:hypothetical protein DMR30_25855 [Klebsiella variicola]